MDKLIIKNTEKTKSVENIIKILSTLKTADNSFNDNPENLKFIAKLIYARVSDVRDFAWLKLKMEDIITGDYADNANYLRINSQTIFNILKNRHDKIHKKW